MRSYANWYATPMQPRGRVSVCGGGQGGAAIDAPSNAFLRYRANNLTGNNGDPIDVWPDISGTGADALQVVGSLKPTLQLNAINGKKALSFNGTLSNMSIQGSPAFTADAAFSLCVVAIPGGAANGNVLTLNGATTWTLFYAPGGTQWGLFANGNSDSSAASFPLSTACAVLATRAAGALVAASWFKSASAIGSTGQALGSIPAAPTTDLIGAYAGPSSLFTGSIAEIILYKRVLSAGEITTLGAYLSAFYGL